MHKFKSDPAVIARVRRALEDRRNAMFEQAAAELRAERPNALGVQRDIDPHDGLSIRRGWLALLDRWAALNGILRTDKEITLDALARGLCFGGRWGAPYEWPEARWACDHPSFFKRDRRAAAIVVEPYELRDFEALLAYAPSIGLVAHAAPNPKASFWQPGYTRLIVLTAPSFGDVRWLPDQLVFE